MNYSANYRELLGIVAFLRYFRSYLEGVEFEIVTDNQVLMHFFGKKNLNRPEARWLETLSEFGTFPITLKKGSVHVFCDILFRVIHRTKNVELRNLKCLT